MKSFRIQGVALAVTLMFLSLASRVHADPVSDWNSIANVVLLNSGRPGGAIILDMAYVHIAVYDAVNAIERRYTPFAVTIPDAEPWASTDAAIAAAAYTVLVWFYPDQGLYLNSAYAHALVDVPNNDAKTRGIAIGTEAAERFLALRDKDGRNAKIPYAFGSGPGVYQLTPGAAPPPATPQTPWIAHLKPFAMLADSQFRAPAPPQLTSELYARDVNEIKQYGVRDGSARTAQQTEIGKFYLDNPGGQLSRNLRLIAAAHSMSVSDQARFFAQAYVTISDAVIAGWDSKFHYNCWRPVTAIRAADTDGNPATVADTSWLPLATTPGHPEYPAAHGCVTGGLAYFLERFFGTSAMSVQLTSASVPGAQMTYHTYASTDSIVREVINARVYGGRHFRNSVEVGAAVARKVADWVADHFFKPSDTPVPTANLQLWLRADSGVTMNGSAVSRWHDQSGHGNDAIQADVARQPVLVAGALDGKPALRFDGANDRLGLTGTTPMHQISIFLVFKIDSGATGPHPYYPITMGNVYQDGHVFGLSMRNDFSGNSPNIIDPWTSGTSWLHETLPGIAAFGEWKLLSITTDKTIWNTTLRIGGKTATKTPQGYDMAIDVPLGSADGLGVGGIGGGDHLDPSFGSSIFKGDIAEVIVYDTVLADADRQAVENYLNTKYQVRPSEVPTANLQLWLKADAGVDTLHGTVSRWHDQSGRGNDALQTDTARQPLLVENAVHGKPALRFDGVNDRLGFTGTTRMSQFSIFIVQEIDSGAADDHFYYPFTLGDSAQTYGLSMRNGFSNNSPDEIDPYVDVNSWVKAVAPGSGCAAFGKWKLICVTANQNMWNTTMHVNGVAATITPQGGANTALSVPLGTASVSEYGGLGMTKGNPLAYLIARCHIAEVLVYNTVLSDSGRMVVEQYLAGKFGIQMGTGIAEISGGATPTSFILSQNYPNPFNPSTMIRYTIAGTGGQGSGASKTKLEVYDVLGRHVANLVDEAQAPGTYEVRFDASGLASGVYFYRLTSGSFVQTKRLLLLR